MQPCPGHWTDEQCGVACTATGIRLTPGPFPCKLSSTRRWCKLSCQQCRLVRRKDISQSHKTRYKKPTQAGALGEGRRVLLSSFCWKRNIWLVRAPHTRLCLFGYHCCLLLFYPIDFFILIIPEIAQFLPLHTLRHDVYAEAESERGGKAHGCDPRLSLNFMLWKVSEFFCSALEVQHF